MGPDRTPRLDVAQLLADIEDAAPVAAADVLADVLRETIDATDVSFLIADLSGGALVRLGHGAGAATERSLGDETANRVQLSGSPHGRALATQRVVVERDDDGTARLHAPVTNRGEAIGVLEVTVGEPPSDQIVTVVGQAAHALAYVVIANRRFTDLYEWGKRSVPLSLAAEIQHRLLPGTYTCEAGQFTLAAWLEPAGNVGGDTFDFAMERDTLHLSMTDAMGHTVESAVLATVLVGALRNARRADDDLERQVGQANAALCAYVNPGAFVTGQVARVDLRAGRARIVNAGHPPPVRLRDGVVEPIPLDADPPFGTVPDHRFAVQDLPLAAGDRLVFLTDGVLERQAGDVDLAAILAEGAGLHPREAVQQLVQAILAATDGELEDDATVMVLDWHGGPPRDRTTLGGADTTGATGAPARRSSPPRR